MLFGFVKEAPPPSLSGGVGGMAWQMILLPGSVSLIELLLGRTLVRSVILFGFILNRKVVKDSLRTQSLCELYLP